MQFEYQSKVFDIEGVSEDDLIYRRIAKSGTFYEIDLLEYMREVKPFMPSTNGESVAIDVGANIGNHSVFLYSFITNHLIAIEPNPNVLPVLRRNLSTNTDGYTLCEVAVGETKSKGSIAVPDDMGDNIGAAKVDLQNSDGDIEISTLDSVFSSWQKNESDSIPVSLIKIDVEGMEAPALKGAKDLILKYKPHIFAEAATEDELQKILDLLQPLGYQKLPGKWATTPVYHFVHNPSSELLATCNRMRLRRRIKKTKRRLTRLFKK